MKAIRWASDRIGEEGVVALVTNNSFLDGVAFDGMRKHLADDFDAIYILDLSGNAPKESKALGTMHNVFGIQVGVSINFFIKKGENASSQAEIFYVSCTMHRILAQGGQIRLSRFKGTYTETLNGKPITPMTDDTHG